MIAIIDRVWRRLREHRTSYKAEVWLRSADHHDVFVTIESRSPHAAALLANKIKQQFKDDDHAARS